MEYTLLINSDTLKQLSLIDINVDEQYIRPATISAQEISLVQLIGSPLYKAICEKVNNNTIRDTENSAYKYLLDNYISIYLAYLVMSDIQLPIQFKIRNKGIITTNDDRIQNATMQDTLMMKQYWSNKADYFGKRLSAYIRKNSGDYPEYCCSCSDDGVSPNSNFKNGFPMVL